MVQTQKSEKHIAVAVVILGTLIIQYHSVTFWVSKVGDTGIAWSIGLEIAALWLWWHQKFAMRFFGFVGTAVLLAGPITEISLPQTSAMAEYNMLLEEKNTAYKNIERLESSIADFKERSKTKSGWLKGIMGAEDRINQENKNIKSINEKLQSLNANDGVQGSQMTIVLTIISLLIITLAQISALRSLKEKKEKEELSEGVASAPTFDHQPINKEPEIEIKKEEHPVKIDEAAAIEWLTRKKEELGTNKAVAELLGEDRREIGYALSGGKRKPAKTLIEKIISVIKDEQGSNVVTMFKHC